MLETLSNKQALADGVLELRGDLANIKLRGGRQAFLARLDQLVLAQPDAADIAPPRPAPLPADRAQGFAREAHQGINGALVRCEERYPQEGEHSVLFVVVDRDADEALQRLIDAGLVAKTTRASRPLFPAEPTAAPPPPLSEAEQAEATALRQQAARKLKMAKLLADGELAEEARAALTDALLPLGRALAIENRLPQPGSLEDALLAPLSLCWKDALSVVRGFVADPAQSCVPVLKALEPI